MNTPKREQLGTAIAKDLFRGQDEHSAAGEIFGQCVPLNGKIHMPEHNSCLQDWCSMPVENCMAPRATVARNDTPAWHGATVAPHATLAYHATPARYATVKGELRVPNTINFRLFPTLDPFAKAVYFQLFLLSHGFRKDTCLVSLPTLSKSVLMSQRKVQNTITYLENRGLVRRIGSQLGGSSRGNFYQVLLPDDFSATNATETSDSCAAASSACLAHDASMAPHATAAQGATLARGATNKYDDDNIKIKSSSKGKKFEVADEPVENHSRAAAPRERKETADPDLSLVRAAYEKATGNRWNKSDSEAYHQNGVGNVPVAKTISAIDAVVRRTPTKINSFKYFVREILAPEPHNGPWQKNRLEKIVDRIRDNSIGRRKFSMADFVEDVKCTCAREDVPFDNDIFNELVG
ncbi:MAG: hypothetical protein JXA73_06130 [Acidobacteria bacterium]|nr:hypothetical protein [Acidobacteriota bacterium]